MKCPKCSHDINDKMLVCPNCKKVLKLVCPKCNTTNNTNTCKKCGFTIINKCYKCGKINPTSSGACSKCGFSTYTSVAINSSLIDEFACLTAEFPNLNDIKLVLGSTQLADKFKANLDALISNYTHSIGLKREIIENIYIIRFNRDISFKESANNAMKAAIAIQNLITELNFKLKKVTSSSLICNIAILKRDVYSAPNEYKSGFNIRLIYQHKKDFNLLNNLQIITDSYVYEKICDNFKLATLTAQFVKNEMMTFFELNLKKYIKIPKQKEEDSPTDLSKLNIIDENLAEENASESIYNIDAISFNELKCTFTKAKSINVIKEILEQFNHGQPKIVALKYKKEHFPRSTELLANLEGSNLFKNVFRVTCHETMKYKPYGFFHELISSIYDFAQSPKIFEQNDFSMFDKIDPAGFIKDLINLNERKNPHPEDSRYSLFDIFFNIFYSMPNSLIYIENFENIDDTSNEILQMLFEKFNNFGVNYLISADKNYSLHKSSHFLLVNPKYTEIEVAPTPANEIIEKDLKKYKNVLDSFYLPKIIQNTKGNIFYFESAIDYLLEKELLTYKKGVLEVEALENILIPTNINELITKRLECLSKDKDAYKTFAMMLLIGPMVDLATINLLEISNDKVIKTLSDKNYIYLRQKSIYIQNYNLYREIFFASASKQIQQEYAKELHLKAFSPKIKHPAETVLFKILGKEKQEFIVWESLSYLNASLGDFSAYLNCSVKFLKLVDNQLNEDSQEIIENYKMEVYENISNILYKYNPNEIYNISKIILNNLEKTTDDKKIVNLCNKMLQGCLIGGNYTYALELSHKILSKLPNASINPKYHTFNITFFLISLIKIEILFSIGNLKDCVEAGDELLEIITQENFEKLKPISLTTKQFEEIIFNAMSFVALSRMILLKDDLEYFINKIQIKMGKLTKVFDLFLALQQVIKGAQPASIKQTNEADDKFSKIMLNFLSAFSEHSNNYKDFADSIYQAKLNARISKLSQIEFMCDLLIGYSYFKLGKYDKATSIYHNVLESSTQNGLKIVTYIAWYLISMLKFEQRDIEVALGIANNAIIQLEKDHNSSEFILFLFKVLLAKILQTKGNQESIELCLNNAKFIKEKYGLELKIGETL